ncbi:unnamed protein product [Urochloa humidicola]
MPRNSPSFGLILESVRGLPRHQRARRIRQLLRHQARHPRITGRALRGMDASRGGRGRGRRSAMMQTGGRIGGGRRRAAGHRARAAAHRVAEHQHLPLPPDACMVPGRILINEPRHCPVHGWTAVLRIEDYPRSEMLPAVVSSYCPQYGWMNLTRDDAEPSSVAAARTSGPAATPRASSPPRAPSPMAISPPRSPARAATAAARWGAPPLYPDSTAAGRAVPVAPNAHPPPSSAPVTEPRIISTGHRHLPNGVGGHPNGEADGGYLPSSDEDEH